MEYIKELVNNEGTTRVILILILVLIVAVLILENYSKLKKLLGIKTEKEIHEEQQGKDIRKIEKEVETVKKEIDEIREYSKEATKKRKDFEVSVTDALADIKDQMLQDKIERYRSQILDFGNACKKREYNKEAYDHILEIYDKYEEILKNNEMTNGKVDLAIAYIKKRYSEYMETGFPTF